MIKCTNLPKHTQILFLDDQYHELMNHKNIEYLQLFGYNYHILPKKMIKIFLSSKIGKIIPKSEHKEFTEYILKVMNSEKDFKVSKTIISKKDWTEKKRIIKQIKSFLKCNIDGKKITANKIMYLNNEHTFILPNT